MFKYYMTRKECIEILNDKSNPLYEQLSHTYNTNYNKCRKYYDELGYKGYTLHHKIVNCTNYEEWNIEEIVPMTRADHSRLHMVYYKQGLGSPESIKKAHETLKKKYNSGELKPWNKGLSKETDSRIKTSPRKGKTGADFPFLCASKKGKSGGWNRGITPEDPRYNSLIPTEEQRQKISERMKLNNPMSDKNSVLKLKETLNKPEVQAKRWEKITGRKKYTNGVECHMFFPGNEPDGYYLIKDFNNLINN